METVSSASLENWNKKRKKEVPKYIFHGRGSIWVHSLKLHSLHFLLASHTTNKMCKELPEPMNAGDINQLDYSFFIISLFNMLNTSGDWWEVILVTWDIRSLTVSHATYMSIYTHTVYMYNNDFVELWQFPHCNSRRSVSISNSPLFVFPFHPNQSEQMTNSLNYYMLFSKRWLTQASFIDH